MAAITIAAANRVMDHCFEQSLITGAMLRVTVDTFSCDRISFVRVAELGAVRLMTGGAKGIGRLIQQMRTVRHVRVVTDSTAIIQWSMDIRLGECLAVMTAETDLFRLGVQQVREI